jgi:N-acetylmuramoyl-L-alanine amidase
VRVSHNPEYTRVVLDLDEPIQHKLVLESNPERITLDATNTSLKSSLADLTLADTPIENIRSSVINKKDVRLVLNLKRNATFKSFELKKQLGNNDRLVIDLFEKPDSAPLSESAGSTPKAIITNTKSSSANVKNPGNELDEPAGLTENIPAPVKNSVDETKVVAEKPFTEIAGKRTILISVDAGHGGEDSGALGPGGMREKDVTLAIAKELVNEINAQPGFNARLTRTGDYYLGLQKRRDLARDIKADLFVSIHADSFTNSLARGASVFALSRRGATSEAARFLAQRENESDLIGGVSLDDKDAMLAGVLMDLSMTATVNSSLQVGSSVLKCISSIAPLHTNHVEQAGFVVLKSPDVPSILVETGFISNKDESRKLASPDYREQMAKSVFKGVHQYFMQNPPSGTYFAAEIQGGKEPPVERQHVVVRGDTLADIAEHYNVSISLLLKYNGLKSTIVKVGQILKIPAS